MHRSVVLISAAFTAAALISGASAAGHDNAVSVGTATVYFGDLNLASAQGAKTLNQRIAEAATHACGGVPQFATHYRDAPEFVKAEFKRCRTQAIHAAINDVRRLRVADAY